MIVPRKARRKRIGSNAWVHRALVKSPGIRLGLLRGRPLCGPGQDLVVDDLGCPRASGARLTSELEAQQVNIPAPTVKVEPVRALSQGRSSD
jgi:hypothetical protein